ncbi:hypothetical protein HY636_00940 [Candidatus Woesearchaeota archaeon]|nr:hypothetical protein [Candidatus Woesearchaeota archaeon]
MPSYNNCQLHGYKSVSPNSVYVSNDTKQIEVNGEPILVNGVIILRRYTTQTEEDVVSYLQEKVRKLLPWKLFGVSDNDTLITKALSPLEQSMLALPKEALKDIQENDACIDFIKRMTSAPPKITGGIEKCVRLSYGLMPYAIIEKGEREGIIQDRSWYEKGLSDDKLPKDLGEKLRITLPLTDEWALPAGLSDMKVLLEYNTRVSDALMVITHGSDNLVRRFPEETTSIVSAFYAGFRTTKHIKGIEDSTDEILEITSIESIDAFHQIVEMSSRIPLGMKIQIIPPDSSQCGTCQRQTECGIGNSSGSDEEEDAENNPSKPGFGKGWLN